MAKLPHHYPAPRSSSANFGPHQTLRNPWLDGPGGPPSHGPGPGPGPGSHSSGSTTYDGYIPVNDPYVPDPPQLWRQHHGAAATTPVYEIPESGMHGPRVMCTLPHQSTQQRCAPLSDRPLTPGELSQFSGNAAVTATDCSECDALDTWCYYCVQLVLGIAALAGLSLLIAAGVLRGQPPRAAANSNLSALPYIGAMLAIVSGALLIVQLCARKENKKKKRRRQHLREQRAVTGVGGTLRRPVGDAVDLIPLQELHKFPSPSSPSGPPGAPAYRQVPISSTGHLAQQFHPLLATRPSAGQHQQLRPQDIILSPSGTPWWRRQPAHPGRAVYPS